MVLAKYQVKMMKQYIFPRKLKYEATIDGKCLTPCPFGKSIMPDDDNVFGPRKVFFDPMIGSQACRFCRFNMGTEIGSVKCKRKE